MTEDAHRTATELLARAFIQAHGLDPDAPGIREELKDEWRDRSQDIIDAIIKAMRKEVE